LEREYEIKNGTGEDALKIAGLSQVERGCKKWHEWYADESHLYHKSHYDFQDDSGV